MAQSVADLLDVSKIPAQVSDVLGDVRRAAPQAVAAGGVLRDSFLGAPPKDIDVFVPAGTDMHDVIAALDDYQVFPDHSAEDVARYVEFFGHRTVEVWSARRSRGKGLVRRKSGLPVQIIVKRFESVGDLLADFDFGFCQVAYDGLGVTATPAFLHDAERNTATYTLSSTDPRLAACRDRARRLADKYPTRMFLVPGGAL